MNSKPINTAKDNDIRYAVEAMKRAGQAAKKVAIQTNTPLIVAKDGKVQAIPPHEIALWPN